MTRALALYLPDLGLAIHRALEARQVTEEAPEAPVLDLGCSDGRFARLWTGGLSRPPRVLGCDLWAVELRRAVGGGVVHAIVADGRRLPLKDGCLATVIANSVLTHVPDLDLLLTEIARVLRPGGQFLATVPGPAFEDQLAWVRVLRALGLPWLARRIGDRYHFRWQQWHRDDEPVWTRRLAAHRLSLIKTRLYPGECTGLVWSLAFSLLRLGLGRVTLLNVLRTLWRSAPRRSRAGVLTRRLAPLLAEPGSAGGSLFLAARRAAEVARPDTAVHVGAPRVSMETKQPDLEAALHWLMRSKIRVSEDEASAMQGGYGDSVDGRTGRSPMLYCEITGYAAQFWLRQQGREATQRAVAAGDCLLRAQVAAADRGLCGSFPYGLTRPEGRAIPAYFSFDAGVCAAALTDLAVRTGEARFAEGARRAGDFLRLMQRADGSFTAVQVAEPAHPALPRLEGWFGDGCALHGKNAIAFLKLWHLTGQAYWRDAARWTLDWVRELQGPRGEFPERASAPESMSHTHCYATEGLLYAGLVLGEDRYLTAGIRGAEWLRVAQRRDGALHRNYLTGDAGLPRAASQSLLHVGPVAQAARIWWVAARLSPGRPWADGAARALRFLARVQAPAARPPGGGAFPQSARSLGPWLHSHAIYSPWEAMFACEAARLWTTGEGETAWSVF
jgi:SAM-dependent methyltransferase